KVSPTVYMYVYTSPSAIPHATRNSKAGIKNLLSSERSFRHSIHDAVAMMRTFTYGMTLTKRLVSPKMRQYYNPGNDVGCRSCCKVPATPVNRTRQRMQFCKCSIS